jgi:CRISPR-associated protein Cas2
MFLTLEVCIEVVYCQKFEMIKNKNALRLSAYRLMWIIVFFDLPTYTAGERKVASDFRKRLLKNGFHMFQFSIYTRPCSSRESADVQIRRVEKCLPTKGKVGIMPVTDKQFAMMKVYYGRSSAPPPEGYQQLLLF